MGKESIKFIIILCSLAMGMAIPETYSNVITMPSSDSRPDEEPAVNPVEEWFQNLNQTKQKSIKLHFYVQDVTSGDNATVWKMAESEKTPSSPSHFGTIFMADNLLTAGPEPESEVVGRAQGLVGFADLHEVAINMVVSIVFSEGKYKGSTIEILGRNVLGEKERELPIVGGSGLFRLARGVALTNTYSSTEHRSHAALEYTLYVIYY